MAELRMVFSHQLGSEKGLEMIKGLLAEAKAKAGDRISDLREVWNGNVGKFSFSVMGTSVSGRLVVGHDSVEVVAGVPWFARGTIKDKLAEQAAARGFSLVE